MPSLPSRNHCMSEILVVHGPNLNLLGSREPEIYGATTLADINAKLTDMATSANLSIDTLQSNAEYVLLDRIHAARLDGTRMILINPGAFTHTSVALRDALTGVAIPFLEIHLSNVHAREPFRHHSYLSDVAKGVICGLGVQSYYLAMQYAITTLKA